MATSDHSADAEVHLQRVIAVLTADFAAGKAVERLRDAVRAGRTDEIVECANYAVEAVMEVAALVTVPDDDADGFAVIQGSVAGCLESMIRAGRADDTTGILSGGELVGDAVANLAVFLKRCDAR